MDCQAEVLSWIIPRRWSRPIPLDVHPASFATLPRLTLQAGLANAIPGAPIPIPLTGPTSPRGVSPLNDGKLVKKGSGKWKEKKKKGLQIRIDK